ncbi:hypothetical protein NQ314_006657 [Rhamnusium bicolor]|uniref:Uncharacterized protein n=1 Tax=Rhamnusium bicolor TaxID=1586634 RepID=A0AAV8YYW8_9CUCU|nr:hypothetical protein NQ314_006657 [Rhamnusium bicolor]
MFLQKLSFAHRRCLRMDILPVHLTIMMCFVCGHSLIHNCTNYKQINKENIRNCLRAYFQTDLLKLTTVPSKSVKNVDNTTKQNKNIVNSDFNKIVSEFISYLNKSEFSFFSDNLKITFEQVNDTINISFNATEENRLLARKMKMPMNNLLQYMIVPGFLMAGILPWVMPGLNMAVMALSMINNMAFTSGLFALVRSYVFDKEPDEHVVYINHGYKNKKHYK